MTSQITSHPMDGEWVDKVATLYLSRYKRGNVGDELERARITNAIRECLPAPERTDSAVPPALKAWAKIVRP